MALKKLILIGAAALLPAMPAAAQHEGHAGQDSQAGEDMPMPAPMPAMEQHDRGALGPYPMSREASGTAWQPDWSEHRGVHAMLGGWTAMAHAVLNGANDWQEGPRGGEKAFVSGMLMGSARRQAGPGMLQLRAMLSPDPLMGKRGYPLLLASGETADGARPLIDRQHPHDAFMELSASYSLGLGGRNAAFVYAGLPGEPAFGPPAFMHRLSIMDSPEAPISHHWLDSTHIAFGVATAGLVLGDVKLEASRFNGREPDQHRWDIETGPLDSIALRLSWNPAPQWSLQASWGHFVSPEQLEPGVNQQRWSASAIYTRRLGGKGWWSTTLAWGRRSSGGEDLDALVLESALRQGQWTLFARAERTENDELTFPGGRHGPAYTVGKASIGLVRDFRVGEHLSVGAGALAAFNFVPRPLEALYAGDPKGAMAFVRVKID
ncbi:MAG TPA: hypothetical protein VGD66_04010 [Allosphingosinicella sp.]|jgi:hypothetical protein